VWCANLLVQNGRAPKDSSEEGNLRHLICQGDA
jgi:hypothetical protein